MEKDYLEIFKKSFSYCITFDKNWRKLNDYSAYINELAENKLTGVICGTVSIEEFKDYGLMLCNKLMENVIRFMDIQKSIISKMKEMIGDFDDLKMAQESYKDLISTYENSLDKDAMKLLEKLNDTQFNLIYGENPTVDSIVYKVRRN